MVGKSENCFESFEGPVIDILREIQKVKKRKKEF